MDNTTISRPQLPAEVIMNILKYCPMQTIFRLKAESGVLAVLIEQMFAAGDFLHQPQSA